MRGLMDSGVVEICDLVNVAEEGNMPKNVLRCVLKAFFEERRVGYDRFYTAKGVNERVDMIIRIWRAPEAKAGMYAVLSDSAYDGQYRITNVQHNVDNENIQITDLTLARMDKLYEADTGDTEAGA